MNRLERQQAALQDRDSCLRTNSRHGESGPTKKGGARSARGLECAGFNGGPRMSTYLPTYLPTYLLPTYLPT